MVCLPGALYKLFVPKNFCVIDAKTQNYQLHYHVIHHVIAAFIEFTCVIVRMFVWVIVDYILVATSVVSNGYSMSNTSLQRF